MGIDLSLCLVADRVPRPRGPADRVVAWARGFVPTAWWLLFDRGDAVQGPQGLALVAPSEAALDRLRRRGPALRAAAGRHALGLRALEAELARAPARFVRAELHELYPTGALGGDGPAALPALGDRAPLEPWPSRLDRGRLLAGEHGGTLADAVVGQVADVAVALPDPATLEARSIAALRSGDAAELDLLEEALAGPLTAALAGWLPMTRRRWGDGDAGAAAAEVVTALAEGRPEPFAPLARTPLHFAAHALAQAVARSAPRCGGRPRRSRLRSRSRSASSARASTRSSSPSGSTADRPRAPSGASRRCSRAAWRPSGRRTGPCRSTIRSPWPSGRSAGETWRCVRRSPSP
jgi:hypothetical protein